MKVVIAGGGFGGLRLARKLNNKTGFEVLLVDRFNYHQFQPLFYQVATAGLDASNISFPLRKAFHNSKNVKFRLADILEIKPAVKVLVTDKEEISYDVLVLATGADTNFFGNSGLGEKAFPMKSTVEALQIRHRLIQNFEDALRATDPEELQLLMNIVVVGGGPTGVELSGALAEMKRYVLPKDYPELDFTKMNIYLLEGSGKTLGTMSEASSRQSKKYLEKLGVTLLTGTLVKDYDGKNVFLQEGATIPSGLVIWAAGIKGNVPAGLAEKELARGNRIRVNRQCEVVGHEGIYAVGDLAYMETPLYPNGHPQVAQGAIQMADLIAENLLRALKGRSDKKEFEYVDKGSMATVGRNLAVVDLSKPKWHFGGFPAWMVWMGLHLMLILGVKNRLFVFLNWLYNYITYDQNLRLLFREFYRDKKVSH
ncbi:MAG: NAD(P)/FAD-dependent oxidoreductase [Chitinophagaceae bacterium]|nr:NAD(P)/FAD-dependent oxidoreductase [Chitinophagaceae bacterium]